MQNIIGATLSQPLLWNLFRVVLLLKPYFVTCTFAEPSYVFSGPHPTAMLRQQCLLCAWDGSGALPIAAAIAVPAVLLRIAAAGSTTSKIGSTNRTTFYFPRLAPLSKLTWS